MDREAAQVPADSQDHLDLRATVAPLDLADPEDLLERPVSFAEFSD